VDPQDHAAQDHAGHDHAGHGRHAADPHAWQNVANVKVYVANIRDGLAKVDPAHAADYVAAADAYLARLDALDREVRAALAGVPLENRRIITTHDAFGYFASAYGLEILAPQGISTESEASPRDIAAIIGQIRKEHVPAVFLETVTDPRQMERIAKESGARIGGKVFSDALSPPDGPAATYIDMIRANVKAFASALSPR
jgi:zinc/manganese transport system substrate-binding protein